MIITNIELFIANLEKKKNKAKENVKKLELQLQQQKNKLYTLKKNRKK